MPNSAPFYNEKRGKVAMESSEKDQGKKSRKTVSSLN